MSTDKPKEDCTDKPIKLKPCPFCGEEAEISRHGTSRFSTIYECTNCSLTLNTSEEFNHGQLWNEREYEDNSDLKALLLQTLDWWEKEQHAEDWDYGERSFRYSDDNVPENVRTAKSLWVKQFGTENPNNWTWIGEEK